LISWHGGGEMNAVAAERLGIGAIRGAGDHEGRFVHKGGLGGFKAMLSTLSDGFNVALTTDFPKVARVAGSGTVMLARESGRPIYPVAAAASPRFELGNWDRTVISLPWSRIAIVVGEPIRVPADAEKAGMEEARRAVEEALNAVTARAYEIVDSRQENRLAHAGRVPDAAVMGSRNCDARSEPRIQ
jgi:hypothetical protein